MLYAILAAPFAAALLSCFASGSDGRAAGRLAFFLSLIIAALGIPLITCMPDLSVSRHWFSLWGTHATVDFSLASDGLSAWLIQLVTWLTPVAILASREQVGERMREFAVAMFSLQGLMILALLSRDLVLFYIGFESMLIPAMVLIALFGGHDRRGAALQFLLYTMAGSIFMLVGIWYLAWKIGSTDLATVVAAMGQIDEVPRLGLFIAFALAFAVKVPLFPLHGWQARAYAEAPTGAVLLIAGAMAKLGAYGFLRFVLPMFPQLSAQYAYIFIIMALISVVGGALMALRQTDTKRMMAYSSLSHLGMIMVAIFTFNPAALSGAAVLMFAHGLSVAAIFLLIGFIERRHSTRGIDDFGGLANGSPLFAVALVVAALASAALPGTAGFAGEFAILFGVFRGAPLWVAAVAGLSTILGAVYLLRLVQRWLYGPRVTEAGGDLRMHELAAVAPLLILSFVFGMYPKPISAQMGSVAIALGVEAGKAQDARQAGHADVAKEEHAER
jgi:NADH-quinone oxidoreductase subunit M